MFCDSRLYGTSWEIVTNNIITLSIDMFGIERMLAIKSILNLIYFSITSENAARWIQKHKMHQAEHFHWIIQTTFTCEKITQYQYFIFFDIMVTVSMAILWHKWLCNNEDSKNEGDCVVCTPVGLQAENFLHRANQQFTSNRICRNCSTYNGDCQQFVPQWTQQPPRAAKVIPHLSFDGFPIIVGQCLFHVFCVK